MSILIWFCRRYCCSCFKRGFRQDLDSDDQNYDSDHATDHGNLDVFEGGLREVGISDGNETASTIPSVITISRRSTIKGRRWCRQRRAQDNLSATSAASNNKQASSSIALSSMIGQRFSRTSRNRDRQRRRRRYRRDQLLFNTPHSPTTPRESSSRTSQIDNYNSFFDHATNITSSCDDMSLPEEGLGIDGAAANKGNTTNTTTNKNNRSSVDPPGNRLEAGEADSAKDVESYPHAIVAFRNPINFKSSKAGGFFDEEEFEYLIDFLVHTEEYVRYPRSKLTVLLRARAPETDEDREELQHLRMMIADASSSSSEAVSAASSPSGKRDFVEGKRQQRPPLQVDITTVSCEEDLLRCAPTGGFLVTFGSVWELPRDYPDFLKDLVV